MPATFKLAINSLKPASPKSVVSVAYHHTDTARLPWILASKKLRPGSNGQHHALLSIAAALKALP